MSHEHTPEQITLEETRAASQGSVAAASAAVEWITFEGQDGQEISIARAWSTSAVVTGLPGDEWCKIMLPGMTPLIVRGTREDVVRKLT